MIVLLVQDREEVIIENSKVLININDCVTAINKRKGNLVIWTNEELKVVISLQKQCIFVIFICTILYEEYGGGLRAAEGLKFIKEVQYGESVE